MSASGIQRRLRKGTLLPEYPGVYRVGHRAPDVEARYMAAVLACGEGALLSGRAAGHLFELLKPGPPAPEVTATTERRIKGNPNAAIPKHRRGIPVRTVARTLVDLAGVLALDELARACHEAGVRYGTTPTQIQAVLARRPRSRGAVKLKQILRGEIQISLSKLERRFLELLRENGLVSPQTNRLVGVRRVDCRWPEQRLIVELDGYWYHQSRHGVGAGPAS